MAIKSAIKLLKKVNLWKTFYFNFHYFPFKTSIRMPIFIYWRSELYKMKGRIVIDAPVSTGMVKFGSHGLGTQDLFCTQEQCGKYLAPYKIPEGTIKGYIHDAGQPTTHFNVLTERGVDSRRIIVDEAAPLFHIGKAAGYPPMMFIVSDNDMKNRYEQTQLVLSTLKHFEYNESKIYYKLMHGSHCHYSEKEEFGRIICEFIQQTEK